MANGESRNVTTVTDPHRTWSPVPVDAATESPPTAAQSGKLAGSERVQTTSEMVFLVSCFFWARSPSLMPSLYWVGPNFVLDPVRGSNLI